MSQSNSEVNTIAGTKIAIPTLRGHKENKVLQNQSQIVIPTKSPKGLILDPSPKVISPADFEDSKIAATKSPASTEEVSKKTKELLSCRFLSNMNKPSSF